MSTRIRGFRPAKTGSGTVGSPLKLPELALADRAPAVQPCPIELEALATIARFVAQPLQLVPLVARCIRTVEPAVLNVGLHGRCAVDVSSCRGRIRPRVGRAPAKALEELHELSRGVG
jgi:hypothetical protein